MNGLESGVISAGIGAVMFGVLYAALVYVPLRGKHAGYTSWLVAIGSAATMFFFGLAYGFEWAAKGLAFFILTGVPMMLGEAITAKALEFQRRKCIEDRLQEVTHDSTQEAAE